MRAKTRRRRRRRRGHGNESSCSRGNDIAAPARATPVAVIVVVARAPVVSAAAPAVVVVAVAVVCDWRGGCGCSGAFVCASVRFVGGCERTCRERNWVHSAAFASIAAAGNTRAHKCQQMWTPLARTSRASERGRATETNKFGERMAASSQLGGIDL